MRILLGISTILAVAACGGDEEGGNGGSSGAAGTGGSGGTEPVVEPATMVQLPAGFWIDSTEVTRAQYRAWLQTKPTYGGQPAECSWNDDYTPGCHWPAGEEPNHPVVCVDWCDAYAYCQGVGKRLCGKIGGGPNGIDDYADATKSQWYYACSGAWVRWGV
jgi:formylglycine-generating enzyme required for sulfatase activity